VKLVILKPDNIGDFVMASGGIRVLAEAAGEGNLVLAVKSDVASLARREFPRARVVRLPIRARRKGTNTTAVNLASCLPALVRLAATRADAVVCLRDKRTFLHSLLFLAPRAGRRVACENSLPRARESRWGWWERAVRKVFRPSLLPYPAPAPGLPSDLGAHRAVVSAVLGHEVAAAGIMPRLRVAWQPGGDNWLLSPLSSKDSKNYDPAKWAAALREVGDLVPPGGIRLAGAPDQAARLREFASALRGCGLTCAVNVDAPVPLPDFCAVVASAALVLTVDTAAAHLACAAGTPAVVVTNGNNKGVYGPYSPNGRQVWLMADLPKGRRKEWREQIGASEVAGAIRGVLGARVE
jgi:ADP-heptose:LPS heptosyltransferase